MKTLKEAIDFVLKNSKEEPWFTNIKKRYPKQEQNVLFYEELSRESLTTLLQFHHIKLTDYYNNSPTIKIYRDFLNLNPSFRAMGHCVVNRPDTRITVSGLHAIRVPSEKELKNFYKKFKDASELDRKMPYRCWYD